MSAEKGTNKKRSVEGIASQIQDLEDELKKTKYNKATQHHIGLVKAKLAKLKEKQLQRSTGGGKGHGYNVKKTGDATVVFVGFPSVGKSTLLNKLTNAESKVGAYKFTTLKVIPGLLEYNHAKIQVLDIPGIIRGASSGAGRGKEIISVARNSDLVIIVIDVFDIKQLSVIQKELYNAGIRLNAEKPRVKITNKPKGGIDIQTTVTLTHLPDDTLKAVLKEYKYNNCEILIHDNITVDELIDVIEANKVYIPSFVVLNKMDLVDEETLQAIQAKLPFSVAVSGEKGTNITLLKKTIFEKLQLMRVYMKEVMKKPDMDEPVIVHRGATVEEVCRKLHNDFVTRFRYCKVWGTSAKFPGQRFKLNHVLKDNDVLELHLR